MTGGAGLPGAVTVSESYKQSPISGPSVVLHCTELLDPPHVNGGAMLNSVKSGVENNILIFQSCFLLGLGSH